MIIDALLRFSANQAVTAAAASTNTIDVGTGGRNLQTGENLYLVVQVTTAFTDASSDSTLAVAVQTDDNEAFSSPTTVATVATLPALSAVGTAYTGVFPAGNLDRYVRLYYTPAGGDLSTGAVSAFLTMNPDLYKPYANNSKITLA